MKAHDRETRERLLRVATGLFAERGFKRVTVRDICQAASANVAAVNYHFGDKLELYCEVLRVAMGPMRVTTDAGRQAGEGGTAEEKLRAYIHVYIHQVIGSTRDSRIHHLMSWELSDPTPALDLIVQQVIRPRMAYLSSLVAELLGCGVDDERAIRCALSIQSLCVSFIRNPVAARLYPQLTAAGGLDALAEHIASFSLAGIRSLTTEREAMPGPARARRSKAASAFTRGSIRGRSRRAPRRPPPRR